MMKRYILFILSFLCFLLSFSHVVMADDPSVLVVELTDTIDNISVEIFTNAMREAEDMDASAVILVLDTPGGGLQETFDIADIIDQSTIPVIGFVYPEGASAWSAGTFLLLSAHVAVMADHSIIGSCQPVEISFTGTRFINESKTINALVQYPLEQEFSHFAVRPLQGIFLIKREGGATRRNDGVQNLVYMRPHGLRVQLLQNPYPRKADVCIRVLQQGGHCPCDFRILHRSHWVPAPVLDLHQRITGPGTPGRAGLAVGSQRQELVDEGRPLRRIGLLFDATCQLTAGTTPEHPLTTGERGNQFLCSGLGWIEVSGRENLVELRVAEL